MVPLRFGPFAASQPDTYQPKMCVGYRTGGEYEYRGTGSEQGLPLYVCTPVHHVRVTLGTWQGNISAGSRGYRGHDEEEWWGNEKQGYRWMWELGYKGAGGEQGCKGMVASVDEQGCGPGGGDAGQGCRER